VALVKGRPVTEEELAILFVSLLDRSALPIQRLKDVFTLRGVEYKVVDIRGKSVLIQNVKSAEKVEVPLLTTEEFTGVSPRPSAPPATAGSGAVF
jgi:Lhr-like helicase